MKKMIGEERGMRGCDSIVKGDAQMRSLSHTHIYTHTLPLTHTVLTHGVVLLERMRTKQSTEPGPEESC